MPKGLRAVRDEAVHDNERDARFQQLLLQSEVRWLFRGKVRFAKINPPLGYMNWVATLACLSDIFDQTNILNASLQGKDGHVLYFCHTTKSLLPGNSRTCGVLVLNGPRWKLLSRPREIPWGRQGCKWTLHNR